MSEQPILLFCDGASSGNPGPSGWGAIVVTPDGHVRELGGRESSATNNQMELTAVIAALREIRSQNGPVAVHTDSVYVIRGITQWIWGWRKKGWKTSTGGEVSNQELWEELSRLVMGRKKAATTTKAIDWRYVRGHVGIPGNERVDEIAVAFSRGQRPTLYDGPLLKYDVPIHDLPDSFELPEMKPLEATKKKEAFSYLSVVNGVPMRHSSWTECEARVKGRSGAKFKKALSAAEDAEILESWGFSETDLRR